MSRPAPRLPRVALGVVILLAGAFSVFALDMPPLTGRVVDLARLLPEDLAASLTAELAAHEQRTGNQVVLLTLPSLEGEPLEDFSHRVATTWRLGRTGTDNGVLVLVVPGDRRVRIEVGYGLEGTLTDAVAARIIRHEMVPLFRAGNYPGGIAAGLRAVLGVLEGTYQPPAGPAPRDEARVETLLLAVLMGALLGAVLAVQRKTVGGLVGGALAFFMAVSAGLALAAAAAVAGCLGALALAVMVQALGGRRGFRQDPWPGGWGSGSFSGSGGFGGGFSGGGGDFGGGGASGSW